ncbi:MAG: hypothetical protein JNG86_02500 [Verrucomicrobiaceae bacterium]|nr:hypothetical protein [Verrucomicrobiaceae bacterium]
MLPDLYDYLYHEAPDGGIPLKGTGIVLGLALIVSHAWVLLNGSKSQAFLKTFPRTFKWGVILMSLSLLWALFLLSNMDMGEFFNMRRYFMMIVAAGGIGMIVFVPEFLAVRALGCLMLLAASPVLYAAFMQPQTSRLLLPILAYVWIIAGMYFVGMPYLMRDWINWLIAQPGRWKAAVLGGIAYGTLMLITAIVSY